MLEEQGQGLLKNLLSFCGKHLKSVASQLINKAGDKAFHNVFEKGKVSEKKLQKLNQDIMSTGTMSKEEVNKICNELKKYDMTYSIVPMEVKDEITQEFKTEYKILFDRRHNEFVNIATQNATAKSLKPKKSIKDTLYKKTKEKQVEHKRNEPVRHKEVGTR